MVEQFSCNFLTDSCSAFHRVQIGIVKIHRFFWNLWKSIRVTSTYIDPYPYPSKTTKERPRRNKSSRHNNSPWRSHQSNFLESWWTWAAAVQGLVIFKKGTDQNIHPENMTSIAKLKIWRNDRTISSCMFFYLFCLNKGDPTNSTPEVSRTP